AEQELNKTRQEGVQQQPQPDTKALLETIAAGTGQQNRIVLKENNKIKIIPTKQVLYLESADDYVKIHTAEGAYLKNKTMAEFERLLEGQDFVRIHRSYLVQVSLITRLEPYEKESQLAILSTGQRLPVSKTGYTKLKLALGL
ncbi:MAG TPA: LytTR family DNA-binding domain-containing protein, partial [Sediminibacterium sp.]|nr:LytTR family DNA-binding domain-containing protein [Sediminibacterium sp.]